jgi:hypothetical protein
MRAVAPIEWALAMRGHGDNPQGIWANTIEYGMRKSPEAEPSSTVCALLPTLGGFFDPGNGPFCFIEKAIPKPSAFDS